MRLNLGAGRRPMDGAVNVDRAWQPGCEMMGSVPWSTGGHDYQAWNLDNTPWPWENNTIEEIHARDLFEHVADPISFMTECHRILMPGKRLWIRTPNISLSLGDAFTDPTHRRFPTWDTFDYWIPGTRYYAEHNHAYGNVAFALEDKRPDDGSMVVILRKIAPEDVT